MSVIKLSDAQVDKGRHALGLDRQNVAYRNFYSGADDDPDWNDLVGRGIATKRKSPVSQDALYHLYRRTAFYFLNSGESLGEGMRFPPEPKKV